LGHIDKDEGMGVMAGMMVDAQLYVAQLENITVFER
tara:strand:- start:81 stop:188 length:108 start_codon:yes stop_codon:yes gene_type:complete